MAKNASITVLSETTSHNLAFSMNLSPLNSVRQRKNVLNPKPLIRKLCKEVAHSTKLPVYIALNIGIFDSITGLWSIVAGDFLDTVCDEDVFLLDTLDDRGGKAARWMGRGCCDGWGGEASDLKKLCCGDGRGS
ncbi:unnamed protein product [Brassica napus]|uniref:(rape) hypothetical protein n=1 Tax=Brassica napus TaxID=3708 RepID=A0A816QAF7_BRANA|nr:unnamed protein product [Brassica napus]